tara:strand:+ start:383 stop:766 length:384 start_codon:yes stop_codon:yes gene_type:complete
MDKSENNWYGPEIATLGDRLAGAREANRLTQNELAKSLGVKVATLKNWEQDVSEPRANKLSMVAGLLNVSVMWLLNGEGEGVDNPDDFREATKEMTDMLVEIRKLKMVLKNSSVQLGKLEKQIRKKL